MACLTFLSFVETMFSPEPSKTFVVVAIKICDRGQPFVRFVTDLDGTITVVGTHLAETFLSIRIGRVKTIRQRGQHGIVWLARAFREELQYVICHVIPFVLSVRHVVKLGQTPI